MKTIFFNGIQIENAKESDDRLNIEGYACHFNSVNMNSEVVNEDSFKYFFELYNAKKLVPKLNYNHTQTIIGGVDDIISDKTGLYMTAHVNRGVKICDEFIIPNIIQGDISQFSTEGYIKDGYNGIIENEDGSYYVKNFLLTMVAITPIPADPDAVFTIQNFLNEYKAQKEQEKAEIDKKSKWYLIR